MAEARTTREQLLLVQQKLDDTSSALSDLRVTVVARLDTLDKDIRTNTASIHEHIEARYVTKEEFNPVKWLIYGFTAIALTAVVGALIYKVIPQ